MEHAQSLVHIIALTLGVSWASGINLYAAMLTLGLLGATGHADLPPGLEILTHPMVISAAGLMYFVEFFADKVPGIDTGWDVIHSFVRIPAAAILAAAASMEIGPAAQVAAALVGGGLATGTHLTKASSRVMVNTSPEPVTNSAISLTEDAAVIAGVWTAINHPVAFLILLALFLAACIWLVPKIWRGLRGLWRRLFFWKKRPPPPAQDPVPLPEAASKEINSRKEEQ
ncbi:MAG: DUF4126 domain-containing protein [Desulfovermiculus sp.]